MNLNEDGSPTMSSKLTLSLIAAFSLSLGGFSVARADDALEAGESGNPHSVEFKDRKVSKATSGRPHS